MSNDDFIAALLDVVGADPPYENGFRAGMTECVIALLRRAVSWETRSMAALALSGSSDDVLASLTSADLLVALQEWLSDALGASQTEPVDKDLRDTVSSVLSVCMRVPPQINRISASKVGHSVSALVNAKKTTKSVLVKDDAVVRAATEVREKWAKAALDQKTLGILPGDLVPPAKSATPVAATSASTPVASATSSGASSVASRPMTFTPLLPPAPALVPNWDLNLGSLAASTVVPAKPEKRPRDETKSDKDKVGKDKKKEAAKDSKSKKQKTKDENMINEASQGGDAVLSEASSDGMSDGASTGFDASTLSSSYFIEPTDFEIDDGDGDGEEIIDWGMPDQDEYERHVTKPISQEIYMNDREPGRSSPTPGISEEEMGGIIRMRGRGDPEKYGNAAGGILKNPLYGKCGGREKPVAEDATAPPPRRGIFWIDEGGASAAEKRTRFTATPADEYENNSLTAVKYFSHRDFPARIRDPNAQETLTKSTRDKMAAESRGAAHVAAAMASGGAPEDNDDDAEEARASGPKDFKSAMAREKSLEHDKVTAVFLKAAGAALKQNAAHLAVQPFPMAPPLAAATPEATGGLLRFAIDGAQLPQAPWKDITGVGREVERLTSSIASAVRADYASTEDIPFNPPEGLVADLTMPRPVSLFASAEGPVLLQRAPSAPKSPLMSAFPAGAGVAINSRERVQATLAAAMARAGGGAAARPPPAPVLPKLPSGLPGTNLLGSLLARINPVAAPAAAPTMPPPQPPAPLQQPAALPPYPPPAGGSVLTSALANISHLYPASSGSAPPPTLGGGWGAPPAMQMAPPQPIAQIPQMGLTPMLTPMGGGLPLGGMLTGLAQKGPQTGSFNAAQGPQTGGFNAAQGHAPMQMYGAAPGPAPMGSQSGYGGGQQQYGGPPSGSYAAAQNPWGAAGNSAATQMGGPPQNISSRGGGGASSKKPCMFFTSRIGCKNGSSCPFYHDPSYVAAQDEFTFISKGGAVPPGACYRCGGLGHQAMSCPQKTGAPPTTGGGWG